MSSLLPPDLADCATGSRRTRRVAVATGVTVALSTVGLLALSGWFITAAAIAGAGGPIAARAFNYLIPSALIRLFAILRTVGRYCEQLLSHRAALSTLASVRTRLFARAAVAEATGVLRLSGGEAAALLGGDIEQLEDRLIRGPAIAGAMVAGLSAVVLGALAGPGPAFVIAMILGTAAWLMRILARLLLPQRARAAAAAAAELKTALTENAAAAGEIAVWGLTQKVARELERTAARHDQALSSLARHEAAIAILVPAAAGIASALSVATASRGAALAAMAALAAGAAGEGLGGLARSEIKAPAIDAALDRLRALASIDEPETAIATAPAPPLRIETGKGYYEIAPGERIAIVGRSGTGKTRLLETFAGLRTDAPQRLLVGGESTAELGLYRLRRIFALVPQNSMLIAGTIIDNLRIARPGLTEAELWRALEVACLADEVRRLPDGMRQWIGEGGLQLSGGQRKRLVLARGLLANRPWLLLDEPSEGLDLNIEARLAGLLDTWLDETNTGLLLVTHRPALLALARREIRL